jgi:hypothetical protein
LFHDRAALEIDFGGFYAISQRSDKGAGWVTGSKQDESRDRVAGKKRNRRVISSA